LRGMVAATVRARGHLSPVELHVPMVRAGATTYRLMGETGRSRGEQGRPHQLLTRGLGRSGSVQRRMPRSAVAVLKTAVEARLPGLLIVVISWCYKPNSHTHQAPGTGSDTQQ
jgi:hypothetical protein